MATKKIGRVSRSINNSMYRDVHMINEAYIATQEITLLQEAENRNSYIFYTTQDGVIHFTQRIPQHFASIVKQD